MIAVGPAAAVTRYVPATGALEALKWFALICMTLDHVNTVLFDRTIAPFYLLGRLAFPVFAMVLGCNLARSDVDQGRACRRLVLWAVIAQPVHALAFGYMVPLNVLATFAVAACCIRIWHRWGSAWALLLFLGLSAFVDYQWFGVGLTIAAYVFFKYPRRDGRPGLLASAALGFSLASLHVINGTWWALLALPLAVAVALRTWHVPRWRWAFYGYYVAHLAALAVIGSFATP